MEVASEGEEQIFNIIRPEAYMSAGDAFTDGIRIIAPLLSALYMFT